MTVDCRYATPWPEPSPPGCLPPEWACDLARREKAKVPEGIAFQTKPEIALALLDHAKELGIRHACVTADAAGRVGQCPAARSRLRRPPCFIRRDRRRTVATRGALPPADSARPLPAGKPTGQPVGVRQATRPEPGGLGRRIPGPVAAVAETRHVPSLAAGRPERWQREQALWRRWGSRYGVLREAVAE